MDRPDLDSQGEFFVPDKLPSIDWFEYQRHVLRYIFAADYTKDNLVLDIACATGYGTYILSQSDAKKVIGCDINSKGLEYANYYYKGDNRCFVKLDCYKLPFHNESFDAIVSLETIEHLSDYEAFLFECLRVLKSGGIFICSTPNRTIFSPYYECGKNKCRLPFHRHEFHLGEFRTLLLKYFHEVILYTQDYKSFSEYIRFFVAYIFSPAMKTLNYILQSNILFRYIKEFIKKIIHMRPIHRCHKEYNKIDFQENEKNEYIYTSNKITDRFSYRFKVRQYKRFFGYIPFELIVVCKK